MKYWIYVLFIAISSASAQNSEPTLADRLASAAMKQVGVTKHYDPSYARLHYPQGDVPLETGVCSDVIVRAFRAVGIDLQKEIHEDMTKHFKEYPNLWGLKHPDKNIDHRRVPNLMKYFERKNKRIGLKNRKTAFLPGDIVAWKLGNGLFHVGMVSNEKVSGQNRYLMVHNIGRGTQKEDVLHSYEIIGHYRW